MIFSHSFHSHQYHWHKFSTTQLQYGSQEITLRNIDNNLNKYHREYTYTHTIELIFLLDFYCVRVNDKFSVAQTHHSTKEQKKNNKPNNRKISR